MEPFLIVALGVIGVIVTLILASHSRARLPGSDRQARTKGADVAIIAVVGGAFLMASAVAAFSIFQWRTAEAQNRSLEGQRATLDRQLHDLASRQHRAWVHVTPSLNGPMIIKGHEVSLAARYLLENTGEAPAVAVEITSTVMPHVELDPLALQKSLCEQPRPGSAATPLTGDSLFPNQSRDLTRVEGVGAGAVDERIARGGGASLELWWVGCVAYQTAGDSARRRSGFVYEVAESGAGPRGIVPIGLADRIIAKSRLVIIPYRGGFFAD